MCTHTQLSAAFAELTVDGLGRRMDGCLPAKPIVNGDAERSRELAHEPDHVAMRRIDVVALRVETKAVTRKLFDNPPSYLGIPWG